MAKLVLVFEDIEVKEYAIHRDKVVIGRANSVNISLDDMTVSSKHAVLEPTLDEDNGQNTYHLRDLSSKNGTYLGGKKITQTPIIDGDEFKIGWSTFRFSNAPNQEVQSF